MRRLLLILSTMLIAALASACATTIRIEVRSSPARQEKDGSLKGGTNDGLPLYMMVRAIDSQGVLSETYDEVSKRMFKVPPDPGVLATQPIMPGQTVNLRVNNPDSELAVYFFFTQPGNKWMAQFHRPLPTEIYIDLGANEIARAREQH